MSHTVSSYEASLIVLGCLSLLASIIFQSLNYFNMQKLLIAKFENSFLFSSFYILFLVIVHLTPGLFSGALYA